MTEAKEEVNALQQAKAAHDSGLVTREEYNEVKDAIGAHPEPVHKQKDLPFYHFLAWIWKTASYRKKRPYFLNLFCTAVWR